MTKFTGRFAEEMERRQAHSDPKPGKQVFYGRLCSGYTKEQAMLTGERWQKIMKERGAYGGPAKYVPTYSRFKEDEGIAEYTGIDITYTGEEAHYFRKEFGYVIEDLEREIGRTEDKECLKKLNEKLDLTKAELDLFNLYNPI